jgi:hypothetical protein
MHEKTRRRRRTLPLHALYRYGAFHKVQETRVLIGWKALRLFMKGWRVDQ